MVSGMNLKTIFNGFKRKKQPVNKEFRYGSCTECMLAEYLKSKERNLHPCIGGQTFTVLNDSGNREHGTIPTRIQKAFKAVDFGNSIPFTPHNVLQHL